MVRKIMLGAAVGLAVVAGIDTASGEAFRSYKPTHLPPRDLVWYAYARPDSSGLIELDRRYLLRVSAGRGPTRRVCLTERSARGLRQLLDRAVQTPSITRAHPAVGFDEQFAKIAWRLGVKLYWATDKMVSLALPRPVQRLIARLTVLARERSHHQGTRGRRRAARACARKHPGAPVVGLISAFASKP
jgi:hypothetical protein